MVDERLDAIADGHKGKREIALTARDEITPYWGFSPRGLRKLTFPEIQRDVEQNKKFYDNPLHDFKFKLLQAVTAWANFTSVDPQIVRRYMEEEVWPTAFREDGEIPITCTKIKTQDSRLLAWDIQWIGDTKPPNVAVKSKGDDELIPSCPAKVVLVLEGRIWPNEESNHFDEVCKILECEDKDFLKDQPFALISSTSGREYETVHTPVSFVIHTMQIALNIQNTHLMFHVIDGQ